MDVSKIVDSANHNDSSFWIAIVSAILLALGNYLLASLRSDLKETNKKVAKNCLDVATLQTSFENCKESCKERRKKDDC